MNNVSWAVTNSATLINYLDNDSYIAHLAEHQEMTTLKKLHYHMKKFDTNVPIDVLVDNVNFPEHDIAHDEYLSNVDIALAGTFDLKDVKFELMQVSWATKNQL